MSHVIPELLYRPLYGPTHRIRTVNSAIPYVRFIRKGVREPLLCDECEMLLGRYESYFSSVWYGPDAKLPSHISDGLIRIQVSGLNDELFKLFHLAILWRASVATLDDFRGVRLGPHEANLRQMLLNQKPGSANDYRIAGSVILRLGSREVHAGVIGVPARQRHGAHSLYSTVYAGCIWHCLISPHMPADVDTLQGDGTLTLTVLPVSAIPDISAGLARATAVPQAVRH
jgi:hypothetical protein